MTAMVEVSKLTGDALSEALEELAHLRIAVFRDWPYLYDGDLAYERNYLGHYQSSHQAVVVAAHVGDWLVGAATASPLVDHASDFAEALVGSGIDPDRSFYCGESVLLPRYRGLGVGHQFFDLREDHARNLGYDYMCFCAVLRPDDHALRPRDYRALDGFWGRRGYTRVPGAVAQFTWKDVDQAGETTKPLQFWMRRL